MPERRRRRWLPGCGWVGACCPGTWSTRSRRSAPTPTQAPALWPSLRWPTWSPPTLMTDMFVRVGCVTAGAATCSLLADPPNLAAKGAYIVDRVGVGGPLVLPVAHHPGESQGH